MKGYRRYKLFEWLAGIVLLVFLAWYLKVVADIEIKLPDVHIFTGR